MPDEMETMLRNSLDAVDRGRRWAILGVGALFVAMVIAVAALFGTSAGRSAPSAAGISKTLYVAFAAGMLFTACCTAVVMFHVTRMTKAVLRAIDLANRGKP